jgi:uncharacterized damage-inducible protein DinB
MKQRYIWVERKFEFELPAWMFSNTVERVRGCACRVDDIIFGLSTDILTNRLGDKWSIQEHIGHLLDLESLWAKRLDELIEGAPHLTAWEVTNRATYEAEHNSKSLKSIIKNLRETRGQFVARLDEMDDSLIERSALHPRLQTPMRTIDLVYFIAEHDDHHLAEITRLKKEFC